MSTINTILFKEIEPSHPNLPKVIAPSIGKATSEKIQSVLGSYNVTGYHLIGGFSSNKLVAIIGLKIAGKHGDINHIAVIEDYRNKGIGKQIIRHVVHYFSLQNLNAETDEEALSFYEKCGFSCKAFSGKYGERYQCILERSFL